MAFLHYLGLLLLSVSWLWRTHVYTPPGDFWIPLVAAGLLCLCFPPRCTRLSMWLAGRRLGAGTLAMILPSLLVLATFPRTYALGPVLLSTGVLCGVFRREGTGAFQPVAGCIIGGAVMTLQGFFVPVLTTVTAHVHNVPIASYIIYPFVKLLDPNAALSGGRIFVSSMEEIFGLGVSLEKLAFYPISLFFVASLASRWWNGDAVRITARTAVVLTVYAGVRFIFVLFSAVSLNDERIFWEPPALLMSLLLLPLFVSWFAPPSRPAGGAAPCRAATAVRASLLWTAAFFLLAGAFLFHDPGTRKQGRVLFDEMYSDWEWSTERYDRDWYGSRSGYNYYSLAEYIDHFFELERGTSRFTPEYLSRYDVVVIKTPTEQFSPEEIDALVRFVRDGGGLFLVGDHTNVFGTSTNLNPLASRFGMRFNYDSTYQLYNLALSYLKPPEIGAHPAVLHVPEFFWATSCSMESPILGENVMLGNALRGVTLDYSRKSYFPSKDEKEYVFGHLVQMAGRKYGKGRVLGHTDSTVFSNFFMFIPGKPETFIGALDWLNRRNRWHRLNVVFFLAGLAAMVLASLAGTRATRHAAVLAFVFGLMLGTAISARVFERAKLDAYRPPEPIREMKRISFDLDPSGVDMPLRNLVRSPEMSPHTFFVWTQRLDFVPSLHRTLLESLEAAPIAVVINPRRRLRIEEIDGVVDFIRKGGDLLLLFDPRDKYSTARDFLGIFRMGYTQHAADTTAIVNSKGDTLCAAVGAGELQGGIPLLGLAGGGTVCAYDVLGEGRFFAFADFHIFSQAFMGATSVQPTLGQRRVFELEFQLLELLNGERRPEEMRPYVPPGGITPPRGLPRRASPRSSG